MGPEILIEMTTEQQRKILERISQTQADIDALKKVRVKLATSGTASATMSSGGGSRSYTRMDISKITEAISALTSELKQLRAMLSGGSTPWKSILVVYG